MSDVQVSKIKVARIYLRVSSEEQDLLRQESVIQEARDSGLYVAGVYREKASGSRADRPELMRLINDLQAGEVVVAERIDRISRLPLGEAEKLVDSIRSKGAGLSVPGIVDLSNLIDGSEGVAKVVLDSVQELLLRIALQTSRDDYEDRRERQRQGIAIAKDEGKYKGRKPNTKKHDLIVTLRKAKNSIKETANLVGCSESQVKRVWAMYLKKEKISDC